MTTDTEESSDTSKTPQKTGEERHNTYKYIKGEAPNPNPVLPRTPSSPQLTPGKPETWGAKIAAELRDNPLEI